MITTPHARPFVKPMTHLLSSCGVDTSKLECYYVFDSGSKVNDESDNGNSGVPTGAFLDGIGRYGLGMSFDTVGDDFVTVGTESNFDLGANTDFSIWCWVKPIVGSAVQILVIKGSGNNNLINLFISNNDNIQFKVGDVDTSITTTDDSASLVSINEWNMVAVTVDRSSTTGIRLYVNGTLARSAEGDMTAIDATIDNNDNLTLGLNIFSLQGYMDIFGFQKSILDSETIKNLYNAGL